jgi:4-aminobutyrate aminotransferase-like enzyme
MWGMEIVDPNTGVGDAKRVKAIRQAALERGLLLISCGMDDEVIRFIPPLTISQKELDQGLSIFEDAIRNH